MKKLVTVIVSVWLAACATQPTSPAERPTQTQTPLGPERGQIENVHEEQCGGFVTPDQDACIDTCLSIFTTCDGVSGGPASGGGFECYCRNCDNCEV
jgi:hypothetical protein